MHRRHPRRARAGGVLGYLRGNVIKYMWRCELKGGVKDLRKARVYLDWLIKEMGD